MTARRGQRPPAPRPPGGAGASSAGAPGTRAPRTRAPRTRAPRTRSGLAGALASGLVAVGLVAAGALPASAHDRLVSSDPESGAVLEAVPAEAVLTFSAQVQELGTVLELQDASGEAAGAGTTSVEGRDVALDVPADLESGEYVVVYRVTSSDGHPISGEVPFTLDVAGAPAPAATTGASPAPSPSASPAATAGAAPSPSASAAVTPSATAGAVADDAEPAASAQEEGLPWAPVLVVLVVLVLGAAAAVVLARGRRGARTR